MGKKSIEKKQYILETAHKVFVEKGYRVVTMKDIVEACQISRGGLYLYFDSVKEIFEEVLQKENEEGGEDFLENIPEDASPADMLALFLKVQKKSLLGKKKNLSVAIFEYYFANEIPKNKNELKKQFEEGVVIAERLIASGVEAGEFYCEDPKGTARNLMYVLEGLRVMAGVSGISEQMIDRELLYIMQGLIIEE